MKNPKAKNQATAGNACKPIVIVGTGDYYHNILAPSLFLLQEEDQLKILATVSTSDTGRIDGIKHYVRKPKEKLSRLLTPLKSEDPIVILGHANELHTVDAQDLLSSGFTVFIEKPYAINKEQFAVVQELVQKFPKRIITLEYYVMMKTIPLLALCGKIRTDSFYFQKEWVMKFHDQLSAFVKTPSEISGRIEEFIGRPKFILVDILEGEGNFGKLEHRGMSLSDTEKGGGMLQDLGLHAVAPLFALESYIGNINESFSKGDVKIARSEEYFDTFKRRFKLVDERIAETYAEMNFCTSKGVPVIVSVGKYLQANRNQRRIIIVGTTGKLYHDLTSNTLYVAKGEGPEKLILECPKNTQPKYYPVLSAALKLLHGNSPFTFHPTTIALRAQQFILNIIEKGRTGRRSRTIFYKTGAKPHEVFEKLS